MKVLLIFPNRGTVTGEPPLGIGYIAAYLRDRNIQVKVLDMTFRPSFAWAEEVIRREKADIVGVYSSTVMLKDSIKMAKTAKDYATPLVIMGGPHASVLPEETLKNTNADAVLIGEGEYSFFKIVQEYGKRGKIENLIGIPNVYVKINGKIKKTEERYFIRNLDEIPFPALDLFDMEEYIKHWFQLDGISPNLRGINVCLSRSCPFSCAFCQPTLKTIFGPILRRRSPQNIIEELKNLKEMYNINAFQTADDIFFIDEKYIEDFCKEMLKQKIDMVWGAQSRVDTIPSDRILRLAYKAGLRLISIGIESATPRILKLYDKKINLDQVRDVVRKLKANGIKIRGYFILGAPTESLEEIKRTIKFATSLEINEAPFSVLTPFPGTYIYEIAKSKGWKINENWDYRHYYTKGGFITGALPERVIRRYQRLAFLRFYLHPYRLGYLINSARSPKRAFTKLKCYLV